MKKKYFVVGATGFVGVNFIKKISADKNVEIHILVRDDLKRDIFSSIGDANIIFHKGDLLDSHALTNCIEPNSIFVNLAYMNNVSEDLNLLCIKNMVSACVKSKIARFLHVSTASVFGDSNQVKIVESAYCRPRTKYARTKLMIENYLLSQGQEYFDVGVIRPTVIFGNGGRNLNKHVVDLIRGGNTLRFFRASFHRGRQLNLVHVSKVTSAIKFLSEYTLPLNGEIFIVGDSENPINNFDDVDKIFRDELALDEYVFAPIFLPFALRSIVLWILGRDHLRLDQFFSSEKISKFGFSVQSSLEVELINFVRSYLGVKSGR